MGLEGIVVGPHDLSIGATIGGVAPGESVAPSAGLIDEVEIYNRALSASEIQAIFNAGSAGKCETLTVLIDIKPGSFPNSINLGSGGMSRWRFSAPPISMPRRWTPSPSRLPVLRQS